MTGKIVEMTEEEYHARPELNSSLLAEFADSPDKALLPRQEKQCFDTGHQFEDFIFQQTSDDVCFDSKYHAASLDYKEPKSAFEIANSGVDLKKYLFENSTKYFTQNGDLNKTNENTYNWIQERIKAGHRHLIGKFNLEMIKKMAVNFLKMEIDLFGDGSGYPVRDLLERAEFQKMVFWEGKRAMFDCFLIWDGTAFVLDIKTAAERQFYQMFKSKYGVIQCPHYTEGARSLIGQHGIERVHPKLIFLVANKAAESKELKYSACLAESHSVFDHQLPFLTEEYQQDVYNFQKWDKAGRPAKGWKEHTDISLQPRYDR